jgi:sugar lactone lactonase YvrE
MVSLFKTDGRRGEHVRFASDEEKEEKQITQKRTMRMDADGCGWMRMDADGSGWMVCIWKRLWINDPVEARDVQSALTGNQGSSVKQL